MLHVPTRENHHSARRRRAQFTPLAKGQHGVSGDFIGLENLPAPFVAHRCEPKNHAGRQTLSGPPVEMLLMPEKWKHTIHQLLLDLSAHAIYIRSAIGELKRSVSRAVDKLKGTSRLLSSVVSVSLADQSVTVCLFG